MNFDSDNRFSYLFRDCRPAIGKRAEEFYLKVKDITLNNPELYVNIDRDIRREILLKKYERFIIDRLVSNFIINENKRHGTSKSSPFGYGYKLHPSELKNPFMETHLSVISHLDHGP